MTEQELGHQVAAEQSVTNAETPTPVVLPKSLTTVTRFSKLLALFLFILLPFAGFYLGYRYGYAMGSVQQTAAPIVTAMPVATPVVSAQPSPTAFSTPPAGTTQSQLPPIDMSSWKTYTNTTYGYSFKYPPSIAPSAQTTATVQSAAFPKVGAPYAAEQAVNIVVAENSGNLSLAEWLKTPAATNTFMRGNLALRGDTQIIIGNNQWDAFSTSDSPVGLPPNIDFRWITMRNGQIYLVSDEAGIDDTTIEQMLSTFTFSK
jgi:hypothetical protein